jgi:hypothetical protein
MDAITRLFRRKRFDASQPHDSSKLANRIFTAYRLCHADKAIGRSKTWNFINAKKRSIHDAILNGEPVAALDDPASSNLFYGFENVFADFTKQMKTIPVAREGYSSGVMRIVTLLAEAIGTKRVWCNEHPAEKPADPSIESMLDDVSQRLGIQIDFPNPFPDEFGLATSRGITTDRAIQAVYQAWRIKQLAKQYGPRVLEIGAGLGRTAYYARKLGITDYTIIDLPMTNVAQANFLGRVVPAESISLFREDHRADAIKILPISEMKTLTAFDVVANTDSFTEMGTGSMLDYANSFVAHGKVLWSVNHETNRETVGNLAPLKQRCIGRFPYWLRPGYVEEIFVP